MPIDVARTVEEMRATVGGWRKHGRRVALVPTMGALHEGHLSLLRRALSSADHVIVSIFVNPSQFAPSEDLAAYPRTFEADLAAIGSVGDALVFAPATPEIYPDGFATTVSLSGPAAVGLEDRFRPTHFAGVATVVAKLFQQTQANVAFFGEKDYQQLKVIERMAKDLDMPIEVIGCATVREADGLAMSSRNRFLSVDQRQRAAHIPRCLDAAAARIRTGVHPDVAAADGAASLSTAGFAIDYFEARNATTLLPFNGSTPSSIRLLAAVRIGATRLIDNVAV
jgi:pantoate--beta-alanine ligase